MEEKKSGYNLREYTKEFVKENYYTFKVNFPKNKKALLQKLAEERNKSMNQMIIEAIEIAYRVDLSKNAPDDQ